MRLWSLIAAFFLTLPGAVWAEERIALLIGNSDYTAVSPLENAANDATLLAQSLEGVGFEVTLVTNTSQDDLKRSIAEFGRRLRSAGPDTVGLFYYAGHGVQSFGANYLLPVDALLTDAADLDLVAFEAASVLRQMASARIRTNIVILDACRNNPFEDILALNDNGLAEMNAPTGTFLAYATSPGAVALDGAGENSPFTAALAEAIKVEGLPIEQAFKRVRVQVLDETRGLQTPWDTSSLTQDFVFRPIKEPVTEEISEQQLWDSVRESRDPVQIMLFLRSNPGGVFAEDARALLVSAMSAELDGVEAEPNAPLQNDETDVFEAVPEVPDVVSPVFFDVPMTEGVPEIVGLTIAQAAEGSPLFSPIDGLPEELWKGQSCNNCHAWTREALCTQAGTYLAQGTSRTLDQRHPYGGSFKSNLRNWAGGGCE